MLEPEMIRQVRELARRGWGAKRIARQMGVARNTVRGYVRDSTKQRPAARPSARALSAEQQALAVQMFQGPAAGNAVVVQRLLREQGVPTRLRTLQRVLAPQRQAQRVTQLASVRFETAPGHQMQIDFGQKRVHLGGVPVLVYLFVAVLSYSRRLFVRALLSQRQDDWKEALGAAFVHFGGLPQTLLLDNAGALVLGRDRATQTVQLHPAFAAFCRDYDVVPRVCQPYRARTKGKTESGVKYVKGNALADLEFASWGHLQQHLQSWMAQADERIHGTTHQKPLERFEQSERAMLRPLPSAALPVRERRLVRRVATDCLVDVDTVRYSVPHRLVRESVEVQVLAEQVRIYHRGQMVAQHRRSQEPHSRVMDPAHYQGLWRPSPPASEAPLRPAPLRPAPPASSPLQALGRSLADYAAVVEGGRR